MDKQIERSKHEQLLQAQQDRCKQNDERERRLFARESKCLRDEFAGLAMQALAPTSEEWAALARQSYEIADAMMIERAKRNAEIKGEQA